jgi:plastocyanin
MANAFFWKGEGEEPFFAADYETSLAVLDRIVDEMDAYVTNVPALPGNAQTATTVTELMGAQEFVAEIVEAGYDTVLSDLEHLDLLLILTNTAEFVKGSENETVWVRNWQWGLSRIAAVYTKRAILNAATWIGSDHPLYTTTTERFDEAQALIDDRRADEYMQLFQDSRCMTAAVYNGIYNPDVTIPTECCALVRDYADVDADYTGNTSRIPVPEACLGTQVIEINEDGFTPSTVRLSVGQEVRFINRTTVAQTLVAGVPGAPNTARLNTGAIAPNGSYATSFTVEGQFSFFSSTDPDNISGGSINVTAR